MKIAAFILFVIIFISSISQSLSFYEHTVIGLLNLITYFTILNHKEKKDEKISRN